MNKETYDTFVIAITKIHSFYNEISILSKKSPDGKLNDFKIKFINKALSDINSILGDGKPFEDFELFDKDIIPSNSDVALMLAQYLKSGRKYYDLHSSKGSTRYLIIDERTTDIVVERLYFLEKLNSL